MLRGDWGSSCWRGLLSGFRRLGNARYSDRRFGQHLGDFVWPGTSTRAIEGGRRFPLHGLEARVGQVVYIRSYAQVYLLQGALLFVVAMPMLLINRRHGTAVDVFSGVGVCVWLFGFLFESVADAQLSRFTGEPQNRGKILQTGLWRFTRHPNYFR